MSLAFCSRFIFWLSKCLIMCLCLAICVRSSSLSSIAKWPLIFCQSKTSMSTPRKTIASNIIIFLNFFCFYHLNAEKQFLFFLALVWFSLMTNNSLINHLRLSYLTAAAKKAKMTKNMQSQRSSAGFGLKICLSLCLEEANFKLLSH